jgi:hypothetical protein
LYVNNILQSREFPFSLRSHSSNYYKRGLKQKMKAEIVCINDTHRLWFTDENYKNNTFSTKNMLKYENKPNGLRFNVKLHERSLTDNYGSNEIIARNTSYAINFFDRLQS